MKNKSENRIISHIVSLVLGIISVATILFWYLSLPTGITAIVLGAKSYKREGKALGLAGMITGIVGTALCFLVYVSLLIILILANSAY
jgi:hypothetical protein